MLLAIAEFRFRLSRVPRAMSHTACRHAPGSVRHGDGAALQCRHGLGDRWDMPRKVLVGFCRWRGRERARLSWGSARRVHVPLIWLWLFLAAARGLAGGSPPFLLPPRATLGAVQ